MLGADWIFPACPSPNRQPFADSSSTRAACTCAARSGCPTTMRGMHLVACDIAGVDRTIRPAPGVVCENSVVRENSFVGLGTVQEFESMLAAASLSGLSPEPLTEPSPERTETGDPTKLSMPATLSSNCVMVVA